MSRGLPPDDLACWDAELVTEPSFPAPSSKSIPLSILYSMPVIKAAYFIPRTNVDFYFLRATL